MSDRPGWRPVATQSNHSATSKMTISYRPTLRHFNNFLTAIVLGLSAYMIAFPFLPYFDLWREQWSDNTGGVRYVGLMAEENGEGGNQNLNEAPEDNRLVLPSIALDKEIVVGEDPSNVHLGAWHRPRSSTPNKGGNTVIVGHRFSYNSPATFYHLDKVGIGDTFAIWWEGREYVYRVRQTRVVDASAIEIEENTDEPIATLYTCTPVWTAQDRLVIVGELLNPEILDERLET